MPKKEYSTELTKMLSELEDPDAKRPTLRRFADVDEEEREIYMKAVRAVESVKEQLGLKVDIPLPPQHNIIEQLVSDIERLKLEIFELKGENKILKGQLKDATLELQRNQGFYDADGNYVE